MSAIRSNSNRTQARKARSVPYARTLFRKLTSFLGLYHDEEDEEATDDSLIPASVVESVKGQASQISIGSSQDSSTSESSDKEAPSSNALRRDYVNQPAHQAREPPTRTGFLGTPPAGHTSKEDVVMAAPTRLPFAFPARTYAAVSSTPAVPKEPVQRTPRMLSKNPNGPLRWKGAGSAKVKRTRNRIDSPALRTPSSATADSLASKDSAGSDAKRRKFAEETSSKAQSLASASTSQPGNASYSTSSPQRSRPTPIATTPARPNALPSSSRLRTPAKPTVPAVSSPLRNTLASSSPGDDSKSSPSQPSPKPTQTANFMAGLIEVTKPVSKPDLSNPYQTACPVGKVAPPRRSKRTRVTGKATPLAIDSKSGESSKKTEMKPLSDYSPQAIIEATVPKGSKRSRPPSHFENPTSLGGQQAPSRVEEPATEEVNRPLKKSKPSVQGIGLPSSVAFGASQTISDVTVEEVAEDVSMGVSEAEKEKSKELPKVDTNSGDHVGSPLSPTSSRSSFSGPGFKPSSIPREPSKLRFSFQADASSTPSSPAPAALVSSVPKTTPPSLPKTEFKFTPPSAGFNFNFPVESKSDSAPSQSDQQKTESKEAAKGDDAAAKAEVCAFQASSLPKFDLLFDAPSNMDVDEDAQKEAKGVSQNSLPTFTFTWAAPSTFSFEFDASKVKSDPRYVFKPSPPKPVKPVVPFPSSFTGATPSFTSSTTGPVKGFDFAAAGMKAPTVSKDSWTCSLCSLSNPNSASQCQTCENPRSGTTSTAASSTKPAAPPVAPTPVVSFNWGAAGMKAPTVSSDTWTCSLCSLSNPTSASQCQTCETPRSGSSSASASKPAVTAPPPPAPVVGFNWGAAGLAAPSTKKDTWTCSLCALSNPLSATKCTTCENPR
ncbi:hypothetical protein D9613_006911 [Agrocybe pediades]|uniref:RanBP2-type domain-containing protein n=1 Tax=Agrocybe pediades TaxID=84607 RepID=A0A8H4QGT5_9AGAR|nr:hypothetical protein D9613_006911 [Agrocybe pediades]